MTIKDIYNLAIKMGKNADPRSEKRLKKILEIAKKRFASLPPVEKEVFDRESLNNPYSDTRIYTHNSNQEVKTILVGVDIDASEILLADRLNEKEKIDLVLAHHPVGSAFASLDNVMHLQTDLLAELGIPINIAESLMEGRIAEVNRSVAALNHYQVIDTAKLLNIPLMCVHTPADNLVYEFLKKTIEKQNPEILSELVDIIKSIPEYNEASRRGAGPKIITGAPSRRCGKIVFTEITGGTDGAKEMYEHMSRSGIGTIISMHMREDSRREAEKHHINVVIAGHIASDSLGLNLFLDELEKAKIKIIPCSGLIRINRIRKAK